MVEQQTARLQQLPKLYEVTVQIGHADVFAHPDGGNAVKTLGGRQVTVVQQPDLHPALQALLFDQTLHMGVLVARERDAQSLHTVVFGSPQQQAAPACADVEEALPRLELQLAADVFELRLLGLGQRHGWILVVGARIHPPTVQPQREEVVAQVVMKTHLFGIAVPLVQAA